MDSPGPPPDRPTAGSGDAVIGRSTLQTTAGLAVSLLFLLLLLREVEFQDISAALSDLQGWWLVAAAAPFAGGLWLRALRWRLVLGRSPEIGQTEATRLVVIGYAANNLLPVRAGELLRAVLVEQQYGGSRLRVLGTIVVERVFDGLVLALPLMLVLATAGGSGRLRLLAALMALGFLAATGLVAWVATAPETVERLVIELVRLIRRRPWPLVERWVVSFSRGLGQLRGLRGWSLVLATSAGSWGLEATAYWLVGEAFGLGLAPWFYIAVAGAANLAVAAPSTAGGIGPFEFFAREVLVVFGIGGSVATAYSLVLHALVLLPVVVAGLLLLWQRQLGFAAMRRPERLLAQEPESTP